MIKKHLKVVAILLSATLLTTSCVGSFGLFNKLASWNKEATGSKILNELIFIVISPAYAVCAVADVFVLYTEVACYTRMPNICLRSKLNPL